MNLSDVAIKEIAHEKRVREPNAAEVLNSADRFWGSLDHGALLPRFKSSGRWQSAFRQTLYDWLEVRCWSHHFLLSAGKPLLFAAPHSAASRGTFNSPQH